MSTFQEYMSEYKKQLQKGLIQKAYGGLMDYVMILRTHLQHKYPDYFVSAIYYGYMDMTYFSFTSRMLQERKLKVALVFIHDTFRFEVWLAGYNKSVQDKFWRLFRESGWDKYRLVPSIEGADSIIEYVIVEDPDFSDLDNLTKIIEKESLRFIGDVEAYLFKLSQ